ncbi:MAG: hypothetical protein EXS14_07485 [Planctomycetes bacterium]|nr:hypothetical protein [Planctomycetota bacterium]
MRTNAIGSFALLALLSLLVSPQRLAAQEPTETLRREVAELRATVNALRAEVELAKAAGAGAAEKMKALQALLATQEGAALESEIGFGVTKIGGWATRDAKRLALGGYFDTEFRVDHAGAQNDTFDQHRLVLQLESDIGGPVSFRSEIEFEGGGFVSGSGNTLTGNQILIEFAEAHVAISDAINFKTGSLLVPFNRFNYEHDAPLQELTDRPLVDRRVVPTTWNDSGIGIYGAFHPSFATIDYDIVLVNGLTERINAVDGTRNARASFRRDNNDNKTLVGRVGFGFDVAFLDALGFGVSGMLGKYDDENRQQASMIGFDWKVRKGPFEIVGEFAKLSLERGPGEISPTPPTLPVPQGMDGWYLEARYRFFPESWRGAGLFGPKSTFTLIGRYDQVDSDTAGVAVDFATVGNPLLSRGDAYRDDRRRLTLGLNFRPTPQSVVKFEYQWFLEPAGIPDVDNDRVVASFATYF